jgi:rubrerythrin
MRDRRRRPSRTGGRKEASVRSLQGTALGLAPVQDHRCDRCGYQIATRPPFPRCPMCGAEEWIMLGAKGRGDLAAAR